MIACTLKQLPDELQHAAVAEALAANPVNAPPVSLLAAVTMLAGLEQTPLLQPGHLAVLVSRYWGPRGCDLTVGFLEPCPAGLRKKILAGANRWSASANIKFSWTKTSPQVRITREAEGYWSYLGTDILQIPASQPTMCLQAFTEQTPESEFLRVVPHEFGHTCGFPHEHQRRSIIKKLDPQKTFDYFQRHYGWTPTQTRAQVFVPLEEASIRGTPGADTRSIMMYSFPAEITVDGRGIPGGVDLDQSDREFAALCYPPKRGKQ
jgi:hypothetical protein